MHSCGGPTAVSFLLIDGWSNQSEVFLCPLTPICLAMGWMNDGPSALVVLTLSSLFQPLGFDSGTRLNTD